MRRGLAKTMLDSVRQRLLECEQHAEEVLFVPSMWSHAIMNEQAAMDVTVQVGWSWVDA
jgi:oxalate decarboxylase/phosphoglucose isomerase-like protein (cupin superfamily)